MLRPLLLLLVAAAHPCLAQSATLIATGDICLARGVERRMAERGRGYPFAVMKQLLRTADISFGNLECCLAATGRRVPKTYSFRGRPRGALALREAGFRIVTLANNHSLDYGKGALAETTRHLRSNGVVYVGAGDTLAEAHTLRIITVRGLRVGFLAYLGLYPSLLPLRHGEPGVAMADLATIAHDVRAARPRCDFLVVALHAGVEYRRNHTPRQQAMAHAAIDAGADLVVGHHPHVVEETEVYRGRPIYYSLGNFIFDPSLRFLRDRGDGTGAVVVARLTKGKPPAARLVPIRIDNRQPSILRTDDLDWVRAELGVPPRRDAARKHRGDAGAQGVDQWPPCEMQKTTEGSHTSALSVRSYSGRRVSTLGRAFGNCPRAGALLPLADDAAAPIGVSVPRLRRLLARAELEGRLPCESRSARMAAPGPSMTGRARSSVCARISAAPRKWCGA